MPRVADSVNLNIIIDLISAATLCLPGTVIAEPGDLYNQDAWRINSILGREFKYPETLAERTSIELAHYTSVAGRRLIIDNKQEDSTDE